MEKRGERMEIKLCGGKPWGFSIKGGSESNRCITVSKLEASGKGEASGLRIGDRIISVNDVVLCGIRKEAVELIRGSGVVLTMEVERTSPQQNSGKSSRARSPPQRLENSRPGSRMPLVSQFQDEDQSQFINSENFNTNYSNNQPRGYVFSENRKQYKDTHHPEYSERNNMGYEHQRKSIEVPPTQTELDHDRRASLGRKSLGPTSPMHHHFEKIDPYPVVNSRTEVGHDRRASLGRKSLGPTSPVNHQPDKVESHPVPPPRVVANRRQGNKSSAGRPRSWHASKHPEVDTEIRSAPLSANEKTQSQHIPKRRSKGWIESEDLRSTLRGESVESLTAREKTPEPDSERRGSRTSENAFHGSCPDKMDYEETTTQSESGRMSYGSSNNYELLSLSTSSRTIDHESSGSNSSGNIEGTVGNKLRASGRYGAIWKLPQVVHRRAKSFDALSEDPSEERSQSVENKAKVLRKSTGHSSAADVSSHKYENVTKKPSSPTKSSINNDTNNKKEHYRTSRHFIVEKGELSDTSSSSFDRISSGGETTGNNWKINNNDKVSNQSENIVIKLLKNSKTNLPAGMRRQHLSSSDQPPGIRTHSPNVPKPRSSVSALDNFEDQTFPIMPNNDEYKKNIQGMSKKVLRVTSFTRKDLELSPPYQNPTHSPKHFGFQVTAVEKNLYTNNGFAAVRSKSTSSLLDTTMASVTIPVTHEQANLMQGKQYCESLPMTQTSFSTVANSKIAETCETIPKERSSSVGRRFRGSKNNSLTDVPENQAEEKDTEPNKTFSPHTSPKNFVVNVSPSHGVPKSPPRHVEAELKPAIVNTTSLLVDTSAEARPKSATGFINECQSSPMTRPKSATNKFTFSPKLQKRNVGHISNVYKIQPYSTASTTTQQTTSPAMKSRVKAAANLIESSLHAENTPKTSSVVTNNIDAELRPKPPRTSLSPLNVQNETSDNEVVTTSLTHVLSPKLQPVTKAIELKSMIISQNVDDLNHETVVDTNQCLSNDIPNDDSRIRSRTNSQVTEESKSSRSSIKMYQNLGSSSEDSRARSRTNSQVTEDSKSPRSSIKRNQNLGSSSEDSHARSRTNSQVTEELKSPRSSIKMNQNLGSFSNDSRTRSRTNSQITEETKSPPSSIKIDHDLRTSNNDLRTQPVLIPDSDKHTGISLTSSGFLPKEEHSVKNFDQPISLKTDSQLVDEPESKKEEIPSTVTASNKDELKPKKTLSVPSGRWSLENSSIFMSPTTTLPASSSYYQTSASKARIVNLVQEIVGEGENAEDETEESEDEINNKKVELLKSIAKKLTALQRNKDSIKMDITENEQLGKAVKQQAEKLCSSREHEKFKTLVEEIDKIFNLLLSIAGRLARVDNALTTLGPSADAEEKNGLLEKKEKLTMQHTEAQSLKENVDRRHKMVSEILYSHMDAEQYADFEHYINMKIALISEQREQDDKMKLGEEQLRELYDSLPESLQESLPLSSIPSLASGAIGTT